MGRFSAWEPWSASQEGSAVLESLEKKLYPKNMDRQLEQVKRRKELLTFWNKYGLEATKDAYGISRRTLFRWQKECLPKSRAHTRGYEKRKNNPLVVQEVIRLRSLHPALGKEILYPLLAEFCKAQGLIVLSESTVGRLLGELKTKGLLPTGAKLRMSAKTGKLLEKIPQPRRRKLRRNRHLPENPGDLLQLDGVLTFVESSRRYTFTGVDLVSRWVFTKTYASNSSHNGADFLGDLLSAAPFLVTRIQTIMDSRI